MRWRPSSPRSWPCCFPLATNVIPFRADAAAAVWQSRAAVDERPALDERTWLDLNLDDVLAAISRAASTVGQAALYHRLRSSPTAANRDAFEALVTRFSTDAAARARAERALGRLQDKNGYDVWWLARPGAIDVRGWYAIFPLLTAVTLTIIGLMVVRQQLSAELIAAVVVMGMAVRVATAARIVDLRRSVRQLAPLIAVGQKLTFLADAHVAGITGTLKEDAARLRGLKTVVRWASEDPLMLASQDNPLAWIASEFLNALYEFFNTIVLLDGNAICFAQRALVEHRAAVVRLVETIGDIDAALSVAAWRGERDDWTRPQFLPDGSAVALSGVRHPLVEEAVPNDVSLPPGRGMVITGSNMSGKSTYLRTVGVNVVLAQTLGTCLATDYRAPLLDVQSGIGRSDDLLAGKSYYLVEVEQVVARLRASEEKTPHLFIFDELFRGTNAIERIAAGEAVLRALVVANGTPTPHVVLAATHDAELVALLADVYDAGHFTDTVTPEGLSFDFRLQAGGATTRNAIALLALRGAPEAVVTRALASASTLEQQRQRHGLG